MKASSILILAVSLLACQSFRTQDPPETFLLIPPPEFQVERYVLPSYQLLPLVKPQAHVVKETVQSYGIWTIVYGKDTLFRELGVFPSQERGSASSRLCWRTPSDSSHNWMTFRPNNRGFGDPISLSQGYQQEDLFAQLRTRNFHMGFATLPPQPVTEADLEELTAFLDDGIFVPVEIEQADSISQVYQPLTSLCMLYQLFYNIPELNALVRERINSFSSTLYSQGIGYRFSRCMITSSFSSWNKIEVVSSIPSNDYNQWSSRLQFAVPFREAIDIHHQTLMELSGTDSLLSPPWCL